MMRRRAAGLRNDFHELCVRCMLRGLRKASSNWLGKTVMAAVVTFLVVSFAIWGIGDIFRGMTRTTVAKIGGTEISGEQFRTFFNERLQQFSRQVGRPVTPQQAQSIGLDQQFLGQLLAETALNEQTQSLRLGLPDAEVARRIYEEPAFRGPTGQFDQARFEQLIRQAGYTEPRYVAEQRRILLRRQISDTVSAALPVPLVIAEAFNRFANEERSADYLVLGPAAAGDIPAPAPDVLAKYFEDRKTLFRAPEYRKVALLVLTPEEIAKTIEVSDTDAKQEYEAHMARYSAPERREVQQIAFPNEDDARQAAEKLASGQWFEVLAGERGLKPTDYNLGLVAKSAIADPAVADAAFALKEGEVSQPVKGRFGWMILRVSKIVPAAVTPFTEAEPGIKSEIAVQRAKAEVAKRRDKIEDELAGGARLEEVAQKLGVPFRAIETVDRSGRGADGNPVAGLPPGVDVISGAFSTDVGVENDPLQTGGGFVWYEVVGVAPSRERSLDEVKDKVEARWRDDEIAARLKSKADALSEKLKGGVSLADVAASEGLKVETAKAIKRSSSEPLPQEVVAALFRTAKDGIGSAEGKDATERVVFRVTDIVVPPFDQKTQEAQRIVTTLKGALSDEVLAQYVARLETNLGTTVNRAAMSQAIVGGSGN